MVQVISLAAKYNGVLHNLCLSSWNTYYINVAGRLIFHLELELIYIFTLSQNVDWAYNTSSNSSQELEFCNFSGTEISVVY
jgi:hypothetical protein